MNLVVDDCTVEHVLALRADVARLERLFNLLDIEYQGLKHALAAEKAVHARRKADLARVVEHAAELDQTIECIRATLGFSDEPILPQAEALWQRLHPAETPTTETAKAES